jgi:hypothetical protein
MCLYHLAACGYFAASGADLKALKEATSAWEGAYLFYCQFARHEHKTSREACRYKIQRCT